MKLSKLTGAIVLANLSLGMASVYAADAPTLKDVLGASGISITGYVDQMRAMLSQSSKPQ